MIRLQLELCNTQMNVMQVSENKNEIIGFRKSMMQWKQRSSTANFLRLKSSVIT
jgi:hypothetical protein